MGYFKLLFVSLKTFFKQEKTIFYFIISGILLSSIIFFVFTNFYFLDKEEALNIEYEKNRVSFSFGSYPNIEEISNRILKEKYVKDIIYKMHPSQNTQLVIASYYQEYKLDKNEILAGRLIKNDETGRINCNESFRTYYEEISGRPLSVGSEIIMNNMEYICSGIVLSGDFDVLMSYASLLDLNPIEIEISYIYGRDTSMFDIEELNTDIIHLFDPYSVLRPNYTNQYSLMKFLSTVKNVFLMLIIAILNYMFFYSFMIKKRLYTYGILSLYGMSKMVFLFLAFFEFFIIFVIGFHLGFFVYLVSFKIINNYINLHSLFYQYMYSATIMFLCNIVIFFIVMKKTLQMSPIKLYTESMVE